MHWQRAVKTAFAIKWPSMSHCWRRRMFLRLIMHTWHYWEMVKLSLVAIISNSYRGMVTSLFLTFLILAFCLLRVWFSRQLHPVLHWVRAWTKRAQEKWHFQWHNVLPADEIAAKAMLSGFCFQNSLASMRVRDKGCIFYYFSCVVFFFPLFFFSCFICFP